MRKPVSPFIAGVVTAALALFVAVPTANADKRLTLAERHDATPGQADYAVTTYTHELVECAAYYLVASSAIKKTRPGDPMGDVYGMLAASTLDKAVRLQDRDAATDALKAAIREIIRDDLKGSFTRLPSLQSKYGLVCKQAVVSPQSRLGYWVNHAQAAGIE